MLAFAEGESWLMLRGAGAATAPHHESDQYRGDGEQYRRQHDVDELHPVAQPRDVLVQAQPHVAQLLADAQLFTLEFAQRLLLIRRQNRNPAVGTLRLQRGELVLRGM